MSGYDSKAYEQNWFSLASNGATCALACSAALVPWLTIPGQEKWYRSVALLWSFGDDTNTATGGGCRVWNGDIAVLNQDAKYQGTFPTASNFATPFQVAAALYFIVFILAFVSFVLALLEKVIGLKPFYKGWWGLVYQGLVLAIVFIATVIAGVKFQELNRYTQSNICQYTIQCNGATSHINACSYSSPLVTPYSGSSTAATSYQVTSGATTTTYTYTNYWECKGNNAWTCAITAGDGKAVQTTPATTPVSVPVGKAFYQAPVAGTTEPGHNDNTGFYDRYGPVPTSGTPLIWGGNYGGYIIDGIPVTGGTAKLPSFPWLQWGYGAGVAITACVVAGFQMFVQFRHYAFETRAGAENKDTSAA